MRRDPTDLPRDEAELKEREAAGLWRAIAHSRKISEARLPITVDVILDLHQELLGSAIPAVAGRFRRDGEDVKKLACAEPPPGRIVEGLIRECFAEFDRRLAEISLVAPKEELDNEKWHDDVFALATWIQHQMVAIHPFCEGNGRIARLVSNIILIRFGLPPTRVKIEGEHKDQYLSALCQVDRHEDYEPLKNLIIEGSLETLAKEEKRRREVQQA